MNNIINQLDKNSIALIRLLSKGKYYLREISEILKISPSAAHRAIKRLLKINFLIGNKEKNKKNYSLNMKNMLLKEVKSTINLNTLLHSGGYKELCQLGTVGIYGSYATGNNDEHSDLDLWFYSQKINPALVYKFSSQLEKTFKTETNILILNKKKLENIKDKDPEFYQRLKLTSKYEGETIFD